jgi:putative oxidoreductase
MFLCRWCIRRFESQDAFILSGEMAVAYFKFHAPQGFWPLLNDGEGAVLYCFIFLYLASTSGGPWSSDRLLRKRSS